jgi:regulator of sirC expression with transglutaminase-like and TPR domain
MQNTTQGPPTPRRLFTSLMKRRGDRIDLALAALLIATEEYPRLAIEDYMERLDQLAGRLAVEVDLEEEPRRVAETVSRFLADEEGFRGNQEEYDDPRNVYLNEVMDRRTGLPILLSIVYIEVGRRVGVHYLPVGMPGHFLLKLAAGREDVYVDPFNAGRLLDAGECRLLYERLFGEREFRDSMLDPTTKRQVVTRVLQNLKSMYLRHADFERALRIVDQLTVVAPWDLDEIRDRGILYLRLGETEAAVSDLESYVAYGAPGPALDAVRATLRQLGVS